MRESFHKIHLSYISKLKFQFSTENQNPQSVQVKKGLRYYRPSTKISNLLTERFDYHFDEIKYSLVTQSFFSKLKSFYKWKF